MLIQMIFPAARRGRVPLLEAFFFSLSDCANKKNLMWPHKGHGEHVLYHTIKHHLTQGWAESTAFKN